MILRLPAPVAVIALDSYHLHRVVATAVLVEDYQALRSLRMALTILRDTYPHSARQWMELQAHIAGLDTIIPKGA